MRTRVKVCGLTRLEDVEAAAQAGADALGFVFVPASRRNVSPAHARALVAAVPPFVQTVALFMNAPAEFVRSVVSEVRPDLLQFHGDEDEGFCASFERPYIKAVPAGDSGAALEQALSSHRAARGFLIDSHGGGRMGGSGEAFDWSLWPRRCDRPLVLAGGLTPENVGEAVRQLSPWGVDVSSGVETSPGIKDPARLIRFINEVKHVQG
ncbi:MAG: phosphoribosylanthranilate isomerase [Halothiobacillaceae bacterium]